MLCDPDKENRKLKDATKSHRAEDNCRGSWQPPVHTCRCSFKSGLKSIQEKRKKKLKGNFYRINKVSCLLDDVLDSLDVSSHIMVGRHLPTKSFDLCKLVAHHGERFVKAPH